MTNQRRRTHGAITRDEAYVSDARPLPEEWQRDNSLAAYRLRSQGGWMGRMAVSCIILALIMSGAAKFVWPALAWASGLLGIVGSVLFIIVGVNLVRRRLFE